ncbi:hypothetical protein LA66_14925 [Aureimonas altamirensis]|uniref:P-type conjugative transfer ATPase TrbB n=1 Tax=Aureimonas altamirensis TaxID=370622 RepID=A0A0B1Q4P7_9HYPH|nr:hypothetical protein LA66_14925 [Aureimonas altamirensis]
MLRTALGPAIAGYLEDPGVVEVMLNPHGRLWVDRLREGLVATDDVLIPAGQERRRWALQFRGATRQRYISAQTTISYG